MIKIGIYGSEGKMSRQIIELLKDYQNCQLVYSYSKNNGSIDELAYLSDVIIDFSSPLGAIELLPFILKHNKKIMIGTTGFSENQLKEIEDYSKKIPIIHAVNTNFSVAILDYLVFHSAKKLGLEYDAEILESHHNMKKDAPSGTALSLGKTIAKARGVNFQAHDHQNGIRPNGAIGFSSIRGGNLCGKHTAMFIGMYDQITLSHTSQSRIPYADGAIKAAIWLSKIKDNGLYNIKDVISIDL